MNSDTALDYALFQLSPRRSRCELFVSGDGKTEKLASGLLKPFVSHLKVAEEQAVQPVQTIRLEVERRNNAAAWFNKGTLERFVRFVSTPEVLELVNTFDAEMSQLEGARRIYSQGTGDQLSGTLGERETTAAAAADITKKELLRAIDLRLAAVRQDLAVACARASAAGFTLDNVSELLLFADHFGAHRLNEACTKFISLCQRRPELISQQQQGLEQPPLPQWKGFDDENMRSSSGSDMSIDEPEVENTVSAKPPTTDVHAFQHLNPRSRSQLPQPTQRAASEPPAMFQQPKSILHCAIESEVEKKASEESATSAPQAACKADPGERTGEGAPRRLSLKDRINFFESKQKEQAAGVNSVTGGSGGGGGSGINRAVGGKVELRRLPSDSSVEKSVLRRWSGASDMSIDFSSSDNRKESGSAAGTPTSSASSQVQAGSKNDEKEAVSLDAGTSNSRLVTKGNQRTISSFYSSHAEVSALPMDKDQSRLVASRDHTTTPTMQPSLALEEEGGFQNENNPSLGKEEQGRVTNQVVSRTATKTFMDSSEGAGLKDEIASHTQFKTSSQDHDVKSQTTFQIPAKTVSAVGEIRQKGQKVLASLPRTLPSGGDNVGIKDQPISMIQFRLFSSKPEDGGVKPKGPPDPESQSKASSGNFEKVTGKTELPGPHSQWKFFPGKPAEVIQKEPAASSDEAKEEKEQSGVGELKLHRQTSAPAPDNNRNLHGRKVDAIPPRGNADPILVGRKAKESMAMFDPPSTSSVEQTETVRPSKGNQQLNDELQIKADELEKLFAAHKLRIHSDQMASSRRSKPAEAQMDLVTKAVEKRPAEPLPDPLPERNNMRESHSNGAEFDATLLLKMVDNQEYVHNMKQKLGSTAEDYRGKFYEKYMQKRDAKLREEWGSKRAQKEAKMKAMHESLERSQAEMKAKFSGSAGKQTLSNDRRRAEKLKSFNARSVKNKSQTVEPLPEAEEEDPQELSEQVHYGEDKSYSDAQYSDGSSRSSNSKKLLSSKTMSSSTPRTSAAPVPKPSVKATNSGSIRRRTQSESPLAQSVPNFSDLRKENTKPLTGISKITTRAQSRNFSRSKSTIEEANLVQEVKAKRSQSMRKSSSTPGELKDLSPLNSDSANLTPMRFSKEQPEQAAFTKIQKNGESKTFLRKGNGIGPGSGAGIAKLRASVGSEILKNGEKSEGLVDQQEESLDVGRDDDDFERTSAEGNLRTLDFLAESDNEKPRLSQESGNSDDPGSANGDILRSPPQVDDDLAAVSSKFDTSTENVQESPEESPGYWNSQIHHSFSYAQEASDIDVSMDSPSGSPASWNSHPLNQIMEADAARMRKKWGSAQIPILAANASHLPRKDVTKGFKRLLKFGRKSRGPESLLTDGVSASTASEGDDDTEDGRDLAARPSDDFRKSRMGYTHPAYDGFNEAEMFPEQVQSLRSSIPTPPANFKLRDDHLSGSSLKAPRSFFSLSSFRSKGSESKLR